MGDCGFVQDWLSRTYIYLYWLIFLEFLELLCCVVVVLFLLLFLLEHDLSTLGQLGRQMLFDG